MAESNIADVNTSLGLYLYAKGWRINRVINSLTYNTSNSETNDTTNMINTITDNNI